MAIPDATLNPRADNEWREKYRDLCREADQAAAEARQLRTNLVKLLGWLRDNPAVDKPALEQLLGGLRGNGAPPFALLSQVIDRIVLEAPDPAQLAWQELLTLARELRVAPAQELALKQLSERARGDLAVAPWRAQLVGLLNDYLAAPRETDEVDDRRLQASHLASLLDWLLLPPDFERRAGDLRDALLAGECNDPTHECGSFLNDLYAFLRRDLRNLAEYLKKATQHLNVVEAELKGALRESRESAAATHRLTTNLDVEVDAIDRAIKGEIPLGELKAVIDGRVQSIRSSMAAFIEAQRAKQHGYEQRITELVDRVQSFESESEKLREGLLAEQVKAYRDTLTQLPNRLAYDERSQMEVFRARRNRSPLCIAILDLDRFKLINDTLGHKVGDKVLRHAAVLCQRRVRGTDLLARYGGEEFVALFPDTSLAPALQVCEELRKQIEQVSFQYQGARVPVTVSIGVTEVAPDESLDSAFERADRALYQAKDQGRNRVIAG